MELKSLLHPVVVESSYAQFQDGHLRDAVLNSIIGVFDYLRERSELALDGSDLANEAFSTHHPRLILSELDTESGENDQVGFMKIYRGAYQGIRNPKAHSLTTDLTKTAAAQYLVFASLLARRIEEARISYVRTQGWYVEQNSKHSKQIFRFYPDGAVITAAVGDPKPPQLEELINKAKAEREDFPRGHYNLDGDVFECQLESKRANMTYVGQVRGERLILEKNEDGDKCLYKFERTTTAT